MDDHTSIAVLNLKQSDEDKLKKARLDTIGALRSVLATGTLQTKVKGLGPEGVKRIAAALIWYDQAQKQISDSSTEKEKERQFQARENRKGRRTVIIGACITALLGSGVVYQWFKQDPRKGREGLKETSLKVEKLQYTQAEFLRQLKEERATGGATWRSYCGRYKNKNITNWTCSFVMVMPFDKRGQGIMVEFDADTKKPITGYCFLPPGFGSEQFIDIKAGTKRTLVVSWFSGNWNFGRLALAS